MVTTGIDPRILIAWRGLLPCWDAWVFTIVLAVVVPTLGYIRFRQLLARGDQAVPLRMKLTLYGRVVSVQWLLSAAMLLILRRHGLSAGDAGERLGDAHLTLDVTFALLMVLAVVSPIVLRRVRLAKAATLIAAVGRLRWLAPRCGLEMAAFVAVCLTAGVCEEMLYRGWLVNILLAATGSTWAAVVAGAIVFGVGHAYQGAKGMLRSVFVGLQLAILYVLVGSLLPGQVLHAGVDLLVGVAGSLAVSRLRSAEAEQRADPRPTP
ncbi:MAG: CPBP family intramembrane metalloprotease [Acidobacteriia bacterium]|nr:CPBP family intramembrane metalloprotease [Terriglobia bacterium]